VLEVPGCVEEHLRFAAERQRISHRAVRSRAAREAEDFAQRIGVTQ
jgi:hypothetical protein